MQKVPTARRPSPRQVMPFPFAPNSAPVREYHALLKAHGPPDAAPSYLGLEGFLAAKVLAEGLRRAGPRFVDISVIGRDGKLLR